MTYASGSFSEIGKKIKALRLELGMTQRALADGIVTRNMLSRIENGEALPSLSTLYRLAERLGTTMSYLLDDSDDGSRQKNRLLLSMIKKEYAAGDYELCLNYLKALEGFDDEKDLYTARCQYLLGVEKLMSEAKVKDAQKLISDALKKDSALTEEMICEGRVYRALLNGYSLSDGSDEDYLVRIGEFAGGPCDLGIFCDLLKLSLCDTSAAKTCAEIIKFGNNAYRSLLLGSVALKDGDAEAAFARLIDAYANRLPTVLKCYCLTLLEKASVLLNELDRAYVYMSSRRDLEKKLK